MNTRRAIYFCLLLSSGLGVWVVREQMIAQADSHLPDSGKVRRTMWSRTGLKSGEMSRLWETHRELFPNSPLRSMYVALWAFLILWMIFGLGLLQL
jgi:hypothetical protein